MQFLPSMQPDQLGGGGKRGLGAIIRAVASLIADIRQTNNVRAAITGVAAMTANIVLTNGVAVGALLVASPTFAASIKQTNVIRAAMSASAAMSADVQTSKPIPGFANLVTRFSADAITPQADNTALPSWTDSVHGIVAGTLNGTAPKYRTARLGSKPSVQFAANGNLAIATPGAMKTALDSQLNTVFIVFKNAAVVDPDGGSFAVLLGASAGNNSIFYNASASNVGRYLGGVGNQIPYDGSKFTTLATTSWNTPQHGNGAGYEIQYVNGGAQYSNNSPTPATASTIAIGDFNGSGITFPFSGDIFDILVYDRPLTPAEMKQLQIWACDKYGQAYPWADKSSYPVFFGDSITQFGGVSSVQHTAPWLAAQSLGLGLGQWDNVSAGGASLDNLIAFAPAFVDGIGDAIGIDTPVITFEWFNQQDSTTTKGAAYLAARKAASSRIKTVWGTSTDAQSSTQGGSSNQTARAAYDAAWDALAASGLPANCDAYMPIHLDAHVGVDQSYLTYSIGGDGVHLVDATTPYLAAYFSDAINTLSGSAFLPLIGALGIFDPANFDAATNTIRNSVTIANPASANVLRTTPRRMFKAQNGYYGPNSNLTIVDNAAVAPDGTMEASTMVNTSAGSWFWQLPNQAGDKAGINKVVSGQTYTFAVSVKWLGTGTGQFKFGSDGALTTFTASTSWQRFKSTFTFNGSNFSAVMFQSADDGTQAANFAFCDVEMFHGSADLNINALTAAPQLLQNRDLTLAFDSGSNVSGGKIVHGANALIQTDTNFDPANQTVLFVAKRGIAFDHTQDSYEPILSQVSTNGADGWQNFSVGPVIQDSMGLRITGNSVSEVPDGNGGGVTVPTHSGLSMGVSGSGPFVAALRLSKGLQSSTFINGVKVTDCTLASAVTPTQFKDFNVGQLAAAFYTSFDIYYLVIYNRVLTDAEVLAATANLSSKVTLGDHQTALFFGSSLTAGVGATNINLDCVYVQALSNISAPTFGAAWAQAGNSLTSILAQEAALESCLTNVPSGEQVIISFEIGANDMGGADDSVVAPFLTNYAALCDRMRAKGRKVIIHTILNRTGFGANFTANRNTVNPILRTWLGVHCDAIADIASDPDLGSDDYPTNATLCADGTHCTTAGYTVWAPYLEAAIDAVS